MRTIEDFLSRQMEGQLDSSGAFQLAPQKMIEKLGGVLLEPQAWILKFVQAANTLGAHDLRFQFGRRCLTISISLPEPFFLKNPEQFFLSPEAGSSHHHLFLGLLCALNLHTSEKGFLSWSRSDQQLACVANHGGKFHFGCIDDPQPGSSPRVQFVLHRRSVTMVEKLFRKACFDAESRMLEQRVRLSSVAPMVDGERLRGPGCCGPFRGQVIFRAFKSLLEGEAELPVPADLIDEPIDPPWSACLEVEYHQGTRSYPRTAPCLVGWVTDGVVTQINDLLADCEQVSYVLYLQAGDIGKDLSTLRLADEPAQRARLHNPTMRLWQMKALEEGRVACQQGHEQEQRTRTQAERASQELKALLPSKSQAPPDLRKAAEGLRQRISQFRRAYR